MGAPLAAVLRMSTLLRRTALAIDLTLLLSAAGHAQSQPPAFASRTEIVLVDFVVNDKSERPVAGLTVDDIIVREDGKVRPIVSFQAFGGDGLSASSAPVASEAPPGSAASLPRVARAPRAFTVLLVDDLQMSPAQSERLRPGLKNAIAKIAESGGALALIAPVSKVSETVDLPAGAAALTAAVDRIGGRRFEDHSTLPVSDDEAFAGVRHDPATLARLASRFIALNPNLTGEIAEPLAYQRSTEVAYEARQRREQLYAVMKLSLDWLAAQPGRHTLLLVSGGFARDAEDFTYSEIVTRSQRVNAPIHFLDVRGLEGVSRLDGIEYGRIGARGREAAFAFGDAAQGASSLSDDTGGITVRNTNDLQSGLQRLVDATRTYYVIGYDPPPHAKPGFHKILVDVKTRGVHVRARRGYSDGSPAAR
jgi:VWFA-related protein